MSDVAEARHDDDCLPALYLRADRSSTRAQKRFLLLIAATLVLVTVGASMGAVHDEWSGWVGAGAFLMAFTLSALAVTAKLERTWYDGRALAESAKSLAWLYMMRGAPFPSEDLAAEQAFKERLRALQSELRDLDYVLVVEGEEVTSRLRATRAAPLATRRDLYLRGRLSDQIGYYESRSRDHRRQAGGFRALTWSAQALGVVGGLLKALGVLDLDLLGIGAACAAAATAWQQTRDHVTLARAYQLTAEDLGQVKADVPTSRNESEWAAYVADAEAAMSREHVMWTARRGRSRQG